MAKQQPRFYPNLPRDKKKPKGRRVDAISVRTDVRVPRIIRADRMYKPFQSYTPNYLEETSTISAGFDSRVGVKNPNWRVTIAQNGDATSGYSREHYLIRPTSYSVYSESTNWLSRGYGTLYGGMLRLENDYSGIEDIAIGRLKRKLSGKVGNAQLGPPLAESREIGRLVRQINGLGMEAFRALLSAKKTKGKSVAKVASNIWLGLGFGVNPLLKDIKSACDSILEYITRADRKVIVTGAAHQEYHSGYKPTSSSEYIAQDASIAWFMNATHVQGVRYVAGIDLKISAGNNYSVRDHLGLELGQLPSTLWELTAFSWAIDYFSTVGAFLEDVFYTTPGTVLYLSKNYKYQSDTVCFPTVFANDGVATISGNPGRTRFTLFTRTKLAPNLPARSLRIKSVDEIASHGATKLLNLAAVLIGRNKGVQWD